MKAGVLFQVLAITNKIKWCYYQGNPNLWVFYCSFSNYKLFQNYITKANQFQAVTAVVMLQWWPGACWHYLGCTGKGSSWPSIQLNNSAISWPCIDLCSSTSTPKSWKSLPTARHSWPSALPCKQKFDFKFCHGVGGLTNCQKVCCDIPQHILNAKKQIILQMQFCPSNKSSLLLISRQEHFSNWSLVHALLTIMMD